jgi:hypothetical protein
MNTDSFNNTINHQLGHNTCNVDRFFNVFPYKKHNLTPITLLPTEGSEGCFTSQRK